MAGGRDMLAVSVSLVDIVVGFSDHIDTPSYRR